jgi:hypothetical protein
LYKRRSSQPAILDEGIERHYLSEIDKIFGMLQLPIGGGRKAASRQLSGLQARQGGATEKEGTENVQN